MSRFTVTRCICFRKSFEEVKHYALENGIKTVEALQKANYCSNKCKLCVPYVEQVLRTGRTAFDPAEPLNQQQ